MNLLVWEREQEREGQRLRAKIQQYARTRVQQSTELWIEDICQSKTTMELVVFNYFDSLTFYYCSKNMLYLRSIFKSFKSRSCLYIIWVRDQFWFIVSCFHISLSVDLAVALLHENTGSFLRGFPYLYMENLLYLFIPALILKKPLYLGSVTVWSKGMLSVEA